MRMKISVKPILTFLTALFITVPSIALPKHNKTRLPQPRNLSQNDSQIIAEALALEVHQDSLDPYLYYYVPPFHVRHYQQGAASLMTHVEKVKDFAEAKRAISDLENFDPDNLAPWKEEEKRRAQDRYDEAEEKLEEAQINKNEDLIKLWEKRLTDREKDLKDLLAEIEKKNEERKNAALQRFYGKASFHLALTGHQVNLISCTNAHEAKHALRVAAREASMSYGGFLSINAYGGFTKHQLAALREYRNKYAPTIKVVLLPVEKLYFKPLTQTVYDETLGPLSSTIFLSTRGSGDYLGSTITMDTTLSGSTGLAMHLSPFIVPVGISAVYRQKAEAFDAELICDFTDGYTAKGSIDVRDGWIFWDNDISNNMQVEDMSKGGCSIKHISGDRTSAEYKALQELEKKFDEIHIHRTQLSFIEKENYYKSLLADAQLNRASEQPSLSGLSNVFFADGFQPIAILALSTAADFHWYTNKQNVSNLSTVKFNKRITSSGDERIVSDLPVNLCLVYNTQLRAYDRCTENEFKQADTMQKGVQEVLKTPECANAPDPLECATRRDAAAILPARESIKEPDNILTNEV